MRPTRRYYIEFVHADGHKVPLFALGTTPCKAKGQAFEMLDEYLRRSPELPFNGWRVGLQDDRGVVG